MSGKKGNKPAEASTDARLIGRDGKTKKVSQVGNISRHDGVIIVGGTGPVHTGNGDMHC